MSKVEGTRLAAPDGQEPNAHRLEAIAALGASTSSRTVKMACAVLVSAVSYERNPAVPSRFSVWVPESGRFRSEYSTLISPVIGLPSACRATGTLAPRLSG